MSYAIDKHALADFTDTPSDIHRTPFKVGQKVEANDGTYMFVQANGAIAQYAAVKIDDDYQAVELTTAISGDEPTKVGVAQVAFADNDYGLVFIGPGSCTVLAAANCAADVVLNTTTTAGVVDDASTDVVVNLKLTTANGGAQAAVAAYATGELTTN